MKSKQLLTKTPANIDNILNLGKILMNYFPFLPRLFHLSLDKGT